MAQSVSNLAGVCPAILTGLAEVTNNAYTDLVTPVGFAQALVDPTNTQGVDVIQMAGGENGHVKQVRVTYKQRALTTEIATTKTCDPATEKPTLEELYTIAMERHHTITVNENTLRALCDAQSAYTSVPVAMRASNGAAQSALSVLAAIVYDWLIDLDPMRRVINQDLITAAALRIGTYTDAATTKNFNVIKSDDHAFVLTGFNQLKQQLSRIGMRGAPIFVGEGNLELAIMAANYGCCNLQGQDIGKMNTNPGFKFYKDLQMGAALGGENAFLSFMPGSMQLMSYNKYVGEFARPIGTKVRGTFPDPVIPGLRYDFSLAVDECLEFYNLKIDAYYDLFTAPTTLYKVGDRLRGVNGIVKGVATAITPV